MIDLTPLEVRKKKGDFRRTMRGYDTELVDDFLDMVADRLEELVRENLTLHERVTRQDQQVAEYRERERALTEALVTAQEMREEIRRQTSREAEHAKRSAEQEAAQVRAAAQRETAELRAKSEQEVAQLRAEAAQEVARLRADTALEAAQLRSSAQQERDRAEEALRQLRARQQHFLGSYRAFLEGELSELGVVTRTLGIAFAGAAGMGGREGGASEPALDEGRDVGRAADRHAGPAADVGQPADPGRSGVIEPGRPPATDTIAGITLVDADAPGDAESIDTEPSGAAKFDAELFDAEPFEPEPFEPEPFDPDAFESAVAAPDSADEDLYDGITLEGDAGIPGPIGLGSPFSLEDEPESAAYGEDEEEDEDDEETSLLLRNAAAAGYRLADADDGDDGLLLLDDVLEDDAGGGADDDKDDDDDDQGWLPTLLEDEK